MTTTRARPADQAEIPAGGAEDAPKRPRSQVDHRNTVYLVGELTELAEPRQRADTGEVLSFRVAVRVTSATDGSEVSPAGARELTTGARRDVVDCVVAAPALRRRLESYQAGDVIEVHGALRHRFWNSQGRVQSRYEVDVGALKRLARARPGRT